MMRSIRPLRFHCIWGGDDPNDNPGLGPGGEAPDGNSPGGTTPDSFTGPSSPGPSGPGPGEMGQRPGEVFAPTGTQGSPEDVRGDAGRSPYGLAKTLDPTASWWGTPAGQRSRNIGRVASGVGLLAGIPGAGLIGLLMSTRFDDDAIAWNAAAREADRPHFDEQGQWTVPPGGSFWSGLDPRNWHPGPPSPPDSENPGGGGTPLDLLPPGPGPGPDPDPDPPPDDWSLTGNPLRFSGGIYR